MVVGVLVDIVLVVPVDHRYVIFPKMRWDAREAFPCMGKKGVGLKTLFIVSIVGEV
jgi:hypothetical protein